MRKFFGERSYGFNGIEDVGSAGPKLLWPLRTGSVAVGETNQHDYGEGRRACRSNFTGVPLFPAPPSTGQDFTDKAAWYVLFNAPAQDRNDHLR